MDSRLFWLALAAFVGAVEGGLTSTMLPMISADMGVTIGQAGLLVVAHGLAYAFGPPLIAVVLGGVGRRRILAGAELGLGICALLMAIAPFFEWMVGIRALLAICAGTFTGTAFATAATIAAPGKRGQSMQVVAMGRSLASLAGVPLGALVATQLDWRFNYWGLAVLGVAAALALYLMLPRGMHGDTQTMRERVRVLGNPGVIPALCATVLFVMGSVVVSVYVAAIMKEAGIGIDYLPLVLLASGIGAVVASLSAGRIADGVGNRTMAIGASLVVTVMLLVLAALPTMPGAMRLPVLLAMVAFGGYVGPGYAIVVASELAHLAPSSVPVAISLNMSAFSIAVAVAAGTGGAIVDAWGASALALGGILPVLGALAIWIAIDSRRRPAQASHEPIEPPDAEPL